MTKETVSEAMGIKNEWFDKTRKASIEIWNETDKVSDALIQIAEHIKDEEFDTDIKLSDYEKKLILAGYTIGAESISNQLSDRGGIIELLKKLKEKYGE